MKKEKIYPRPHKKKEVFELLKVNEKNEYEYV